MGKGEGPKSCSLLFRVFAKKSFLDKKKEPKKGERAAVFTRGSAVSSFRGRKAWAGGGGGKEFPLLPPKKASITQLKRGRKKGGGGGRKNLSTLSDKGEESFDLV